jgi:hypothetical protein
MLRRLAAVTDVAILARDARTPDISRKSAPSVLQLVE